MPHASRIERDLAEALASRLKELREAAGLTQEQVAHSAGISRDYYGRLEAAISHRGYRNPTNYRARILLASAA